jgi:hypothetical protein
VSSDSEATREGPHANGTEVCPPLLKISNESERGKSAAGASGASGAGLNDRDALVASPLRGAYDREEIGRPRRSQEMVARLHQSNQSLPYPRLHVVILSRFENQQTMLLGYSGSSMENLQVRKGYPKWLETFKRRSLSRSFSLKPISPILVHVYHSCI